VPNADWFFKKKTGDIQLMVNYIVINVALNIKNHQHHLESGVRYNKYFFCLYILILMEWMLTMVFNSRTELSRDNWETPPDLFRYFNSFYHFTVDAAASNKNALCKRYWTEEDSGLEKSWKDEIVFLNPPFCNWGIWAKKSVIETKKYECTVLMLIPSGKTDTNLWGKYITELSVIYWIGGRVNYLLEGKKPIKGNSPNFATCAIEWRYKIEYEEPHIRYISRNSWRGFLYKN
jgi:phage N-6-adenine-methyltransferase